MKNNKLLIGIMSVCLLFSMTGCGKKPKLENGEEVIASIEGKNFTANDLYKELKKQGGTSILVNMIDEYIINKEVEDSEEAKNYAESMIKQYKLNFEQQGEDFESALLNAGYENEAAFKTVLISSYKRNTVTDKYIKETITDEELKAYYDEHVSDELSVKHILIAPESSDTATTEEKTAAENAALEKAKSLIEQLNNGADFETLAKENSDDEASKSTGGVLNNVVKEGYVTEFWNAANALTDGTYTIEPVKTEYGYHIIYKVSTTAKQSFEDMKDTLYTKVTSEKKTADDTLEDKTWVEIRKKYNLSINDSDIDSTYKTTIKSLDK